MQLFLRNPMFTGVVERKKNFIFLKKSLEILGTRENIDYLYGSFAGNVGTARDSSINHPMEFRRITGKHEGQQHSTFHSKRRGSTGQQAERGNHTQHDSHSTHIRERDTELRKQPSCAPTHCPSKSGSPQKRKTHTPNLHAPPQFAQKPPKFQLKGARRCLHIT